MVRCQAELLAVFVDQLKHADGQTGDLRTGCRRLKPFSYLEGKARVLGKVPIARGIHEHLRPYCLTAVLVLDKDGRHPAAFHLRRYVECVEVGRDLVLDDESIQFDLEFFRVEAVAAAKLPCNSTDSLKVPDSPLGQAPDDLLLPCLAQQRVPDVHQPRGGHSAESILLLDQCYLGAQLSRTDGGEYTRATSPQNAHITRLHNRSAAWFLTDGI